MRFLRKRELPPLLRVIHDPPPCLYLRGAGEVELLSRTAVAVVGARACSPYGAQVARMLGRELAAAGVVVVSGLARGIDGEAHRGALAGIEPAPWRFPARNRIIAGLCAATVVVEARERSGALITSDFALEEGREVFAVPGEITSTLSVGTNALLRLGATPLTSAADVLESLGIATQEARRPRMTDVAAAVLERLPAGVDDLVRGLALPAGEVAAALAELELAGAAQEGDGLYRALQ